MRISAGKLLVAGFVLNGLIVSAAVAGSDGIIAGDATPVLLVPRARPTVLAQNMPATNPSTGQDQVIQSPQNLPPQGQPATDQPALGPPIVNQPATGQSAPVQAAAIPPPGAEIPKPVHGSVPLESGSGKILTLTVPAANIYVADPKVAEVRPASSTSLFVFGVGAGHTTIAAVDAFGRLLADYDVTVRPSGFGAREAQTTISRLIPGSRVQVRPQGKGLMLIGGVANASDAAQAMMIAKGYGGEGAAIDNQINIAAPTQVTLQVRVAEMKRSIVRNLGIDWGAAAQLGTAIGAKVPSTFTPLLSGLFNGATCNAISGRLCFDAILNALAKDGLANVLAEPNLTVMSGQAASFQAGGEYPYPVLSGSGPGGSGGSVTVAFKQFGVLLSFLPTVLSDGRINLHVRPEVSELDTTNLLAVQTGSSATLSVPSLKVRRVETTVELGSGESFAIAGMLQTSNNDNSSGIPGLGDTPIIGALFRTNNLAREQTELVIIVTPVLVRPVRNVAQLQLPGEGYKLPGDIDRLLLQRQVQNRDGSTARPVGEAGFIVR